MIDSCVNTHLVRFSLFVSYRLYLLVTSHLFDNQRETHKHWSLALPNLSGRLNMTAVM